MGCRRVPGALVSALAIGLLFSGTIALADEDETPVPIPSVFDQPPPPVVRRPDAPPVPVTPPVYVPQPPIQVTPPIYVPQPVPPTPVGPGPFTVPPPPPPPPLYPGTTYPTQPVPVAPLVPTTPLVPITPVQPPVVTQPPAQVIPPAPPAAGPRLVRRNLSGCDWPRDADGWTLFCPGGPRLGRTEVAVEALYTLFEDMDGTVGEGRPGSLRWNDYDGEFGGRGTLRHALTPFDKVEARAAFYNELSESSSQTGVLGFSPPAFGASPVTGATVSNRSELVSVEANWVHETSCCDSIRWSTILGLRYLDLEETASATFSALAASLNAEVNTDFIAGQVGGQMHWLANERLEIGLGLKLLLGSKRSNINVTDTAVFSGGPHASNDEDTSFGFGAEVEVSVLWRLSANFGITAGYTLLFVDEVVRANDAMNFGQAATGAVQAQQSTSTLVNHTFYAGIQFNF